jgi:hypothetical protein
MIGGEHYLPMLPAVDNSLGKLLEYELGRISYFATGRDALFTLLQKLPNQMIYLPDLICYSVYQACLAAKKKVVFYSITSAFMHSESIELELDRTACLFVMHYFGMANFGLIHKAKEKGLLVISDVTHLLFNSKDLKELAFYSDYLVASLRKTGPFPDGGFVSSQSGIMVSPSESIREEFFSLRAAGLLSRGCAARANFDNDENFFLLQKAEQGLDKSAPGSYQCSYFSKKMLFIQDMTYCIDKTNRNMQVLMTQIVHHSILMNQLNRPSPFVVCLFENELTRDLILKKLAEHRCFFPVHWRSDKLPVQSFLATRSFSIPCDARYDTEEMALVSGIINLCLKN